MQNLTSKELTALSEQLEQESVIISKYRMYAQNTADTELKASFESIAAKHCAHFDQLYSLLG